MKTRKISLLLARYIPLMAILWFVESHELSLWYVLIYPLLMLWLRIDNQSHRGLDRNDVSMRREWSPKLPKKITEHDFKPSKQPD